jgi:hypothetical protein
MKKRNKSIYSATTGIENIVPGIIAADNVASNIYRRIINRVKEMTQTGKRTFNETSKILDRKVDAFWEERSG